MGAGVGGGSEGTDEGSEGTDEGGGDRGRAGQEVGEGIRGRTISRTEAPVVKMLLMMRLFLFLGVS